MKLALQDNQALSMQQIYNVWHCHCVGYELSASKLEAA